MTSSTKAIFILLALCLASLPSHATTPAAGTPCVKGELGMTVMSADGVNILACLQNKPGNASGYTWKNFMPDVPQPEGAEVKNCEEGALAVFEDNRYTCKTKSACTNGDLLTFQLQKDGAGNVLKDAEGKPLKGTFVCENSADSNLIRNKQIYELPVYDQPGPNHVVPADGSVRSTLSFTGHELFQASKWPKRGKLLFTTNYTAKTTGAARFSAVVPIRVYQKNSSVRGLPIGEPDPYWEQTFLAELYVEDGDPSTQDWVMIGDLYNPDSGISGASGDVGTFFTTFDIVEGHTYKVDLYISCGGNKNEDNRVWAGTLWPVQDVKASGYVEIEEMSGHLPIPWDFADL